MALRSPISRSRAGRLPGSPPDAVATSATDATRAGDRPHRQSADRATGVSDPRAHGAPILGARRPQHRSMSLEAALVRPVALHDDPAADRAGIPAPRHGDVPREAHLAIERADQI